MATSKFNGMDQYVDQMYFPLSGLPPMNVFAGTWGYIENAGETTASPSIDLGQFLSMQLEKQIEMENAMQQITENDSLNKDPMEQFNENYLLNIDPMLQFGDNDVLNEDSMLQFGDNDVLNEDPMQQFNETHLLNTDHMQQFNENHHMNTIPMQHNYENHILHPIPSQANIENQIPNSISIQQINENPIPNTISMQQNKENKKPNTSSPISMDFGNFKKKYTPRKVECVFCKNNGEPESVYRSHNTRDKRKRVQCPRLREYKCRICGAFGDNAHTIKHCPQREQLIVQNREYM